MGTIRGPGRAESWDSGRFGAIPALGTRFGFNVCETRPRPVGRTGGGPSAARPPAGKAPGRVTYARSSSAGFSSVTSGSATATNSDTWPASPTATLSVPRNHVHSSAVAIVYSTMIVTKSTA